MNCDLCGTEDEDFYLASVEGVNLNVCENCKNYGTIIRKNKKEDEEVDQSQYVPTSSIARSSRVETEQLIESVVRDFPTILKNAREKRNLKQKEVGTIIKEKESVIHKLESGALTPSMRLAKKLEKFYHVKLIEKVKEEKPSNLGSATADLTIGDLIKVKKK